jgi:hypothetical protein
MGLHDRTKQTMYLPQGGNPEEVNITTLMHPGLLGGRFINPSAEGNKEYQLVKVDSTATGSPVPPYDGATAWWTDKDAYMVGTAAAGPLGRGSVAGRFTFAAALGNYTCIQTEGRGTVKVIDAPTAVGAADGRFVIPSATNGKADILGAGTAATYGPLGRCASTINPGDNTVEVDLDVPETP